MYYIAQVVPNRAFDIADTLRKGFGVIALDKERVFFIDLNRRWPKSNDECKAALAKCNAVSGDFVILKL